MTVGSELEAQGLKAIGYIVALTLRTMGRYIEPGVTTRELDKVGARVLAAHGAQSAPQLMYDFPGVTCISVNEEAAHGLPGERVIQPGDIVNIDVSAEKNGFFADSGFSFLVPPVTDELGQLVSATKAALKAAMSVARAGNKINQIGKQIEAVAHAHGLVTLRDLTSHGIGRQLHEEPEFIPNYYDPNDIRQLHKGLVITIEPFLSTHSFKTTTASDGWTLLTEPFNRSAQFEHTMIITEGEPVVVT